MSSATPHGAGTEEKGAPGKENVDIGFERYGVETASCLAVVGSREGAGPGDADDPDAANEGRGTAASSRPRLGATCIACAEKDDRMEDLSQLLAEARERCGRAERQLEQRREQLARQAKDLASQAARATETDAEISRLTRQLAAASLLPGYRGPPPPPPPFPSSQHQRDQQWPPQSGQPRGAAEATTAIAGTDGTERGGAEERSSWQPWERTQEEFEAHLRGELREARQAAEAAQAAAEAAARESGKLRQRVEAAEQQQITALREEVAVAAESLRRERERCDAATLAATEAERVTAGLVPVVAERDRLRKQLQEAKAASEEGWRAAAVAREGHHSSEAAADMAQGRLAAAEAVNRGLREELAAERRAAAAAAAAAEGRERQLQVEISRLRADLTTLMAEREILLDTGTNAGATTAGKATQSSTPRGNSGWLQPQPI